MNKPNIQLTLRRFLHTRYGMEGMLSMHAHHVCHTVEHPHIISHLATIRSSCSPIPI